MYVFLVRTQEKINGDSFIIWGTNFLVDPTPVVSMLGIHQLECWEEGKAYYKDGTNASLIPRLPIKFCLAALERKLGINAWEGVTCDTLLV